MHIPQSLSQCSVFFLVQPLGVLLSNGNKTLYSQKLFSCLQSKMAQKSVHQKFETIKFLKKRKIQQWDKSRKPDIK